MANKNKSDAASETNKISRLRGSEEKIPKEYGPVMAGEGSERSMRSKNPLSPSAHCKLGVSQYFSWSLRIKQNAS